MKLCYQVATPDVKIADSVTAYQGPIEKSFSDLAKLGFDGVELMTLDPHQLNWNHVKEEAKKNNLIFSIVCTGEIFGQLGLSYTNPDSTNRAEAIKRTKDIIDFASYLGANINIGRIRGQYCKQLSKEQTELYAIKAFKEISDYALNKNVSIALEPVTILQTNFINTVEEAVDMVKRVNKPNFKIMMDIFHMNLEEKNIYETIKKYCEYTIHVHLADNNRRYPGHCGLNFEKILSTFKQCNYNGNFCTEIYQIPNMTEAARKTIEYLKPLKEKIYSN